MIKQLVLLSLTMAPIAVGAEETITFADPLVEEVCIKNWDANKDGALSVSEAAAVTDLGNAFSSDEIKKITSFDELKYFTGLKTIPNRAFYQCFKLASVVIPEGVTSIGDEAFYYCRSLSSLTIPSSVSSIGEKAFYYEVDPEDVKWGIAKSRILNVDISDLAAWCNIDMADDVFTEIGDRYRISESWLYTQAIQTYTLLINGSNWSELKIPEEVTEIKRNTFAYCRLDIVELHDGITSVGDNAFRFSHARISGGKAIQYIGESAFEYVNSSSLELSEELTYIGSLAFAYSGFNSIVIPNSEVSIGNYAFEGLTSNQFVVFTSESLPSSFKYNHDDKYKVIMSQTAYDRGYSYGIKNFSTYSKIPMYVRIKTKGAISAVLDLYPINNDGSLDDKNMTTVTSLGLSPGQYITWKKDAENYGILSEKPNETLALVTQDPKALSTTKARLIATVEEADDLEHFGFEWRRIDAPDLLSSNIVKAPLYNGKIVGSLNNLNPDVYYKYRPFYQSDSGEIFYGEWIGLFTGDANVFFEPEIYTKEASDITKVSALLTGIWIEGTEDFEEKGFEYWPITESNTRVSESDVRTVHVDGNQMTAIVEDLVAGTKYGFRSYVKTTSGSTTYGQEKRFTTEGDLTSIDPARLNPQSSNFKVQSSIWYDLSGRRLTAAPTAKGLYIFNGKVVVIK